MAFLLQPNLPLLRQKASELNNLQSRAHPLHSSMYEFYQTWNLNAPDRRGGHRSSTTQLNFMRQGRSGRRMLEIQWVEHRVAMARRVRPKGPNHLSRRAIFHLKTIIYRVVLGRFFHGCPIEPKKVHLLDSNGHFALHVYQRVPAQVPTVVQKSL